MQASLQARRPRTIGSAPFVIRPWRPCGGNRTLTERSPWSEVRGCAPGPALLKGRKTHEGHLVTQTISSISSQAPRSGDPASQAPGAAGERALDCLLAAGFERTEPPILHPAAIFLDMSGEEVRRRLFLTSDAAGEELCLRPEYTIPSLSKLSQVRTRPARSPNIPIWAPFFALARAKSASRRRPGSRASADATPKRPTRRCSRSPWRRRPPPAAARSSRGSATLACLTPCLMR